MVDDHDETREAVSETLKGGGARVLNAHSAQAALLTLEQERPDLLVTDLEMPEVDGWELLLCVRALPPERGGRTPAFALTVQQHLRRQSAVAESRLPAPPCQALRVTRTRGSACGPTCSGAARSTEASIERI